MAELPHTLTPQPSLGTAAGVPCDLLGFQGSWLEGKSTPPCTGRAVLGFSEMFVLKFKKKTKNKTKMKSKAIRHLPAHSHLNTWHHPCPRRSSGEGTTCGSAPPMRGSGHRREIILCSAAPTKKSQKRKEKSTAFFRQLVCD